MSQIIKAYFFGVRSVLFACTPACNILTRAVFRHQAKTYAEKAIKLDPAYLEPVYVMADILAQQRLYAKGVEL